MVSRRHLKVLVLSQSFFADDVKVYLKIVKYDDCVILQKALDLISVCPSIGSCKYRSKSVVCCMWVNVMLAFVTS